ncbi:MAG: hypothetical protein JNN12_03065 [Bacteroidetes Order II. Incertae sedis bacterium]|nr:hypothetical protein [Bacteroidetes Order II. bacterium]
MSHLVYQRIYTFLLLSLVVLFTGCEREFVEPKAPGIKVFSPQNPDVVVDDFTVFVSVEASSFQEIKNVTIRGDEVAFNRANGRWEGNVSLKSGVNTIVIAATDIDGLVARDTLQILRLYPRLTPGSITVPYAVGGHSATLLPTGQLLISGGAKRYNDPAINEAFVIDPQNESPQLTRGRMVAARTGHASVVLPDGRALLLGGSRRDNPVTINDLVETVEVYDPELEVFSTVPVGFSDPIRRTNHVAYTMPDPQKPKDLLIYLFGGRGDIRYGTSPTLGTRQDLRVFRFRNDSLLSAGPTFGFIFKPMEGPSLIRYLTLNNPSEQRFLITGARFSSTSAPSSANFRLYQRGTSLTEVPMAAFKSSRIRHSSSILPNNVIVFMGGVVNAPNDALRSIEAYAPLSQKMYRFGETVFLPERRFGHTATNWTNGRILVIGGFDQNGNALSASHYWTF